MPQVVVARAETVAEPGANISGLRRPSAVGALPPHGFWSWFGGGLVSPTPRQSFAFSGV
ncbi:MAG: hypothetical protein U0166_13960 [Acidobacteriota bacterium]